MLISLNTPSSVVCVTGDSIANGLARYQHIWKKYFDEFKAVNFGIGGDRTQHVLWRANNGEIPTNMKYVVIHCGTNNIDHNAPNEIANGVFSIGLTYKEKKPECKVMMRFFYKHVVHFRIQHLRYLAFWPNLSLSIVYFPLFYLFFQTYPLLGNTVKFFPKALSFVQSELAVRNVYTKTSRLAQSLDFQFLENGQILTTKM